MAGRVQIDKLSNWAYAERGLVTFTATLPSRNVAFMNDGAYVAHEWTSPTYNLSAMTLIQRYRKFNSGLDYRQKEDLLLPECVISTSCLVPRRCWQFPGDTGHIGIHLPRAVAASAISLYYPGDNLLKADDPAMPRQLRAWSLIDDVTVRRAGNATTENPGYFYQETTNYTNYRPWTSSQLAKSVFLLLGTWENPVRHVAGYTEFKIPKSTPTVESELMILEVRSNWDVHKNTCLYMAEVKAIDPANVNLPMAPRRVQSVVRRPLVNRHLPPYAPPYFLPRRPASRLARGLLYEDPRR